MIEHRPTMQLVYRSKSPLFNYCTLYSDGTKGLAVIQQRFNSGYKCTWWSNLDEKIARDILCSARFPGYFESVAMPRDTNGLYPVIPVRQVMWALRLPPLKKLFWETRF